MNGRARLGTTGMHILAMVWLPCVALIAAACGTPAAGTLPPAEANATAAPAPVAAAPAATAAAPPPAATHADVVLTPGQVDQVTVKVGQVINIPDEPAFEWVVDYRPEVLLALTPPEKIGRPGPGGWVFRAIAPRSAEIALESIAPPCLGGSPGPPNSVILVLPREVLP